MAAATNRRRGAATPGVAANDERIGPRQNAPVHGENGDAATRAPTPFPRGAVNPLVNEASAPAPRTRRGQTRKAAASPVPGQRKRSSAAPAPRRERDQEEGSERLIELGAAAATIRRALFNERLEDGLYVLVQVVTDVLAPAVAQVWLAEQTPWVGELSRTGGQEITPVLRLRAEAACESVSGQWPLASLGPLAGNTADGLPGSPSVPLAPAATQGLVTEIASTRRTLVLRGAADIPLAQAWLAATPAPGLALATLAAYPLLVRGHLLGVLVLGTAREPAPHHLAALEAAAENCAMAVERDHLLSYTHTQETLAQTVVRQAPVAVGVLMGPEHVFELANPAFAQLLGVEGSLMGRRLADVVVGAERLRESLRLDAVYATGEAQAMVEMPIHQGRGLTYWNVTSSPLVGRQGSVRGVLVAAVEMTHQVRERGQAMEAALVARERVGQMMALHATSLALASQFGADPRELLADILRRSIALLNARAGVVYLAVEGGALEVTVAHGLRGDYTGRRVAPGEGLAGQAAHTRQGLRLDDTRLFAGRPAVYAGEAVTAIMSVPLIQRQRVVGVLEVLDDADERTFTPDDLWLLELFAAQAAQGVENARTYVEMERALQAQRELDRMKDDFIATASHELRTPLTGVQGYLDLLLDYPGSRDEPLAVEFVTRAAESAGELAELTARLLQTARLESGQIELRREAVGLDALVRQIIQARPADTLARHAAGGAVGTTATHTFTLDIVADVRVCADTRRLREVIENLVNNAVKYSPHGGTVRFVCQVLASDAHTDRVSGATGATGIPPRGHAVLTISDTGIGIAPEERERLFGRFARLDAARTSQIRGTGLGLYICRQLVEAMGGSIWLEQSTPGQGSTFALALPLADEVSDHVPAPVEP